MGRTTGNASFSMNLDMQVAAPIDARYVVDTYADLSDPDIWVTNGGGTFMYVGLRTSVIADTDTNKNGVYMLTAIDKTNEENPYTWERVGTVPTGTAGEIIVSESGQVSLDESITEGVASMKWTVD